MGFPAPRAFQPVIHTWLTLNFLSDYSEMTLLGRRFRKHKATNYVKSSTVSRQPRSLLMVLTVGFSLGCDAAYVTYGSRASLNVS